MRGTLKNAFPFFFSNQSEKRKELPHPFPSNFPSISHSFTPKDAGRRVIKHWLAERSLVAVSMFAAPKPVISCAGSWAWPRPDLQFFVRLLDSQLSRTVYYVFEKDAFCIPMTKKAYFVAHVPCMNFCLDSCASQKSWPLTSSRTTKEITSFETANRVARTSLNTAKEMLAFNINQWWSW